MVPQVLAVIQVTTPPAQRGRAFGLFGATIGLAAILGPLVGGILLSLEDNFLHAIERSLLYEVGVFGLAALLVGRLPRVHPASRFSAAPGRE